MASCARPSRLDRVEVPARSRVVKIRPTSPRAARLWLVCRARVLLPESIVPVKNCSSATWESCHAVRAGWLCDGWVMGA